MPRQRSIRIAVTTGGIVAANPSEYQEQTAFIKALGFLKPPCVYLSVPNEGKRSVMQAARLKALGMTPGASDILLLRGGWCGVIEMKSRTGKQSENQKEFQAWCVSNCVPYALCRSCDEALLMLVGWGILSHSAIKPFLKDK